MKKGDAPRNLAQILAEEKFFWRNCSFSRKLRAFKGFRSIRWKLYIMIKESLETKQIDNKGRSYLCCLATLLSNIAHCQCFSLKGTTSSFSFFHMCYHIHGRPLSQGPSKTAIEASRVPWPAKYFLYSTWFLQGHKWF